MLEGVSKKLNDGTPTLRDGEFALSSKIRNRCEKARKGGETVFDLREFQPLLANGRGSFLAAFRALIPLRSPL